jgi:hypothetical protein
MAPEPYAVIVYNDPYSGSDYFNGNFRDYDSTTWTGILDDQNHFKVHVGEFKPNGAKLRVVICHVNGGSNEFEFPLATGADGTPDIATLVVPNALHDAFTAWGKGDVGKALELAAAVHDPSPLVQQWSKTLIDITKPEPDYPAIADLPADVKEIPLSRVKWDDAAVGWGKPARNCVPAGMESSCPFLCGGGKYFTDGLYAHAPSHYAFNLGDGSRWKSFTATAAMQADATGSAVFVIKLDGEEKFRSRPISGGDAQQANIDLTHAKKLELITEESRGGNRMAWAIWGDVKISQSAPSAPELLKRSATHP